MVTDLTAQWQRFAASQHGAISIAQLEASAVTERSRRTLVARGVLSPAAPRVYVVTGSPATIEQRQHVGLLTLGPSAVLSHEAAARLHGFDRARADVIELTVPRPMRSATSPFRVHSTIRLPRVDRAHVHGFRCTSATRTVIDLAGSGISRLRLEAAIDSAVRAGLTSPDFLLTRLAALGRRRAGARRLAELLVDAGGHTMLERRFLQIVRRAGLPRPRTQVVHAQDGRTFARVDFLFEEHGIVVEVSGRQGHSSPAERRRDARRRNELQDAGREVYEYTWEDITIDPDDVGATMRRRLDRARDHAPVSGSSSHVRRIS